MGARDGGVAVGIPADGDLTDHPGILGQTRRAAPVVPPGDQILVGLGGDEVVGQRGELLHRALTGHRRRDGHRNLGHVPDARGVDLEVVTLPVDELAGEQFPDDPDGFGQHLLAARHGRPAVTHNVLVEVLPAAHAQREPAVGQDLHRGRLLRDDGGVVAHGRAGDVGHQLDALGGVGDGPQHGPGVARVALRGEPRKVVVAAHLEVESGLLSRNSITDKVFGSTLLSHQGVAESGHAQRGTPLTNTKTVAARRCADGVDVVNRCRRRQDGDHDP